MTYDQDNPAYDLDDRQYACPGRRGKPVAARIRGQVDHPDHANGLTIVPKSTKPSPWGSRTPFWRFWQVCSPSA